jgi:hypothetical protein
VELKKESGGNYLVCEEEESRSMLHAPGESGTRSLLHLKFSSEAWHQWVGVLKLVKVKKLEPATCEYCKTGSTAEVFPLPVKCIRLCPKEQRILP